MKYIGYYDEDYPDGISRSFFPAGRNKMQYIAKVIAESERVDIVSPSGVIGEETSMGSNKAIGNNVFLHLFLSIGKRKYIGKLSTLITMACFTFYLLFHTDRNEKVIVYHSMGYCKLFYCLKKIKKFYLILEMEELYSDVNNCKNEKCWEMKLAGVADAFIFPTQMLSETVNISRKPEIIIHGTYQVEPELTRKESPKMQERQMENALHVRKEVRCVYAGTFDPRKGGAAAAAAAAEFLPFGYHIHILGFGSEAEKKNMQDTIDRIAKKSKAKVTYDGLLTGEDYIRFIQNCDIGLSTQNPDAAFNATSFPSKILSYMANGLRVVSIRIPAIEQSAVGDMLYYYDKQTPEEIARAILSVNMRDGYDSRDKIRKLDKQFQRDLSELLEK